MSGGGGAAPEPRKHGKAKKRKKSRRLGIRIDMTPLVDVAFLLLTFFMLTTSMSRPQTMEINLPPDETKVDVPESNLLTLFVNAKGDIFWSIGSFQSAKRIEFVKLRAFLKEQNTANPKLITLLKIDREGKYNTMVNMMDELNLANVTRFSLAPMLEADKALILKAQS